MARTLPRMGRKAAGKGAKAYAALQLIERVATPTVTRTRKRTVLLVGGAATAAGAAGVYLFDPQQGNRRRAIARDRMGAALRRRKHEATRKADYAAGQAKGAAEQARGHGATRGEPKPNITDQELAHKVESVIFRDPEVPKGDINVDGAGQTVTLRGEVPSEELAQKLVAQAQEIPEVERVENLLHTPGQPAPTRADAPASQRA